MKFIRSAGNLEVNTIFCNHFHRVTFESRTNRRNMRVRVRGGDVIATEAANDLICLRFKQVYADLKV